MSGVRQAIRSSRIVTAGGIVAGCVVFENGRVLALEPFDARPGTGDSPGQTIDVGDRCLLPGLVDSHVHINDPGRSEWEGFRTATRAAAAGGFTCLADMPLNSIPSTTDVRALQAKRAAAQGACQVDVRFWGGAVEGNARELARLAQAGVAGFKAFLVHPGVEEFSMIGEAELREAMPVIAKTGLPLLVHAEDPAVISKAQTVENGASYSAYLSSRPDEAEVAAIELMIRLSREYRCRVHIVHLATAAAVPLLREARAEGVPISVETCPHYLYFAAEEIADKATEFKCAPPIRSAANRDLLWKALREGVIDLIATDHSPCPPEMKAVGNGDFFRAWGGIASLSVALSVVWTGASKCGFDLSDVVRWMGERPAALAGVSSNKGRIAPGYDADFVVFDPDESFVVGPADLHFRHKVSPYLGRTLRGRVRKTFVRGICVFDEGSFPVSCAGRECRVGGWTTTS